MPITSMGGTYFFNGRPFKTLQEAKMAEMAEMQAGRAVSPVPQFDDQTYLKDIGERYAGNILPQMPVAPVGQAVANKPQSATPVFPPNPAMMMREQSGSPAAPEAQPKEEMGLLGRIGKSFGDMDQSDILMALGSGMLGLSQDKGLQQLGMAGFGQVAERGKTRNATAQANKTVEAMLKAGKINEQEAKVLMANPSLIGPTYTAMLKDERTALQKDYEYAKANGFKGSVEEFKTLSTPKTTVNVGDKSFQTEVYKDLAGEFGTLVNQGVQARRSLAEINSLEKALANAPQGGQGAFLSFASNLGIKLDGASDIEAATAIINRLVPAQRPAGSGPMSDADLALFKQSLPRIINSPQGNAMIIQTLKSMAQYDMQMAAIANKARLDSSYTPEMAYRDMQNLQNPLGWLESAGLSTDTPKQDGQQKAANKPASVDQAVWDMMTPEQKALFN